MEFSIISEGVTDQIVLETILCSFFEDKNLSVNPLQPKPNEAGNWDKVFHYIESSDFRDALTSEYRVDYIVIQIDTDFMRGQEVPLPYRFDTTNLSQAQMADEMRKKLIIAIGEDFFQIYQHHIIFAIAVDSIECWFLPAYYENEPQKASKYINCLDTLNQALQRVEKFVIIAKEPRYYHKICRRFRKKNDLTIYGSKNFSLGLFLDELNKKCRID